MTSIVGTSPKLSSLFLIVILLIFLTACNASNTAKGTAIGVGAGAAVGAVIGRAAKNTAVGAIVGAAVGGTAGALIGRHMDKQAAELRADLKGAKVERVGEGIRITFDSGLMFPVDSYALSAKTGTNINDLATTLKKYDDTMVLIEGHTDASGGTDYNENLSVQRAESVKAALLAAGLAEARVTTSGYGENQPIADNETASGRKQNRRVEVAIFANDKMKKAAKKGKL